MSRNERDRSKIMAGVAEEDVTLIAASGLMGVSYRQGKRIWRRYQDEGDDGLVHRLRGKPSPRRKFVMLMSRLLNHRRLMMLGVVVTSQVMTVFLLVVPTR